MTSKKPKIIARSTRFFHPHYAPTTFSQSAADQKTSKEQSGTAEAFPFYQTTSGNAFGYNFRMRQQHKDAGYIARPIAAHQLCDTELATAPLFRRGADGVRQMYADEPMDAKKSKLVHPPVRPHVPASELAMSHDKRKFAKTYKTGHTQTATQALAYEQAQMSFTTGDGTTVVSAAATAAASLDGAGGATSRALAGKGSAASLLAATKPAAAAVSPTHMALVQPSLVRHLYHLTCCSAALN